MCRYVLRHWLTRHLSQEPSGALRSPWILKTLATHLQAIELSQYQLVPADGDGFPVSALLLSVVAVSCSPNIQFGPVLMTAHEQVKFAFKNKSSEAVAKFQFSEEMTSKEVRLWAHPDTGGVGRIRNKTGRWTTILHEANEFVQHEADTAPEDDLDVGEEPSNAVFDPSSPIPAPDDA
jgi:hypothetical protein